MEYTFKRNLYGEAEAILSSEQHAFGLWLSEDMLNSMRVTSLLEQLNGLLHDNALPFTFLSSNYTLTIDRSSVELHSKNSNHEDDISEHSISELSINKLSEHEDDFQLSDENHHAHCGPEDFYALLKS